MTGQVKFGLVKSDRSSQKNFGPKNFLAQTFFDPTFLYTLFFLDSTLLSDPNIFWTLDPKFCWTKIFFGTNIFLDTTIFCAQNLFGPKIHLRIEFDFGVGPTCFAFIVVVFVTVIIGNIVLVLVIYYCLFDLT